MRSPRTKDDVHILYSALHRQLDDVWCMMDMPPFEQPSRWCGRELYRFCPGVCTLPSSSSSSALEVRQTALVYYDCYGVLNGGPAISYTHTHASVVVVAVAHRSPRPNTQKHTYTHTHTGLQRTLIFLRPPRHDVLLLLLNSMHSRCVYIGRVYVRM